MLAFGVLADSPRGENQHALAGGLPGRDQGLPAGTEQGASGLFWGNGGNGGGDPASEGFGQSSAAASEGFGFSSAAPAFVYPAAGAMFQQGQSSAVGQAQAGPRNFSGTSDLSFGSAPFYPASQQGKAQQSMFQNHSPPQPPQSPSAFQYGNPATSAFQYGNPTSSLFEPPRQNNAATTGVAATGQPGPQGAQAPQQSGNTPPQQRMW